MTTVDARDLQRLTAWASRAIPGRPPHPVLAGIVLETDEDGYLVAVGFDHDIQCTGRIAVEDGGQLERTIVQGGLLSQVVAKLTGPVEVSVDEQHMVLRDKRNRYRLITMPVRDYPILPTTPPLAGTAAHLDTDLARAAFAAAHTTSDPKVPVHLVWLDAKEGQLTIRATDRFRVARVTTGWDGDDVVIPLGAHQAMAALKALGQGPVDVLVSGNRAGFEINGWRVTFAGIDADQRIIASMDGLIDRQDATGESGTIVVGREQLLDALGGAKPVLNNEYQPINIGITDDALTLSAGADSGWERTIESDLLVPIPDAEVRDSIMFAPALLGSVLEALTTSHAHIVLPAPDQQRKPCVVFGGDADHRATDSIYIAMPFTGIRQAA